MDCDKETLRPVGEIWEDKFGGEIWFKSMPGFCGGPNPTAEVRVKTPWGESEYVYIDNDKHFIKTYTSGNKIYSVDIFLFCGMETTAIQADTCYEIDKCVGVTCDDECLADGTLVIKKCNPETGSCIPDKTEPLSDECTGSVNCQAYDSVSKAALEAKIFFDNLDIGQVTPFIITKVVPGQHTVKYVLDGYAIASNTFIASKKVQFESNMSMIPLVFPGFDINVNIPGLLPNQDLHVRHVINIPFTDRWIPPVLPPLIGKRIEWNDISNRIYKARQNEINCNPAPSLFSGNALEVGENYAIQVGDQVVFQYFDEDVFKVTDTTTTVNITKQSIPPEWLFKLCSFFDVAEGDCIASFYNVIPDIIYSAEDLSIIIEGKSSYPPYNEMEPTPWNYAFVGLTFIPGGGVVKGAGKAGVKAVKSSKLYPDIVQSFIRNAKWTSGRDPHRPLTFMEAMFELQGPHLDEVVAKLELGDIDSASKLITEYLPLGKTPEDSVKDLGGFTSELFKKLPHGAPDILIREAGLEKAFNMNVEDIIFREWPPGPVVLDTIKEIFVKFPPVRKSIADDITNILKDTSATPEQIQKAINAAQNYAQLIEDVGSKIPLDQIDDMILNAVDKVGYKNTPDFTRILFETSLRKTFKEAGPIVLTQPQTKAIRNIIEADPVGFSKALLGLDDAYRLNYINSLKLSGIEGFEAASKTEGIQDIARNEEIYSKFGFDIKEVADAFTNNNLIMPEYWNQLGIKSFEGAKAGKLIDLTPPSTSHLLADLAESRLSREVAENLVETKLLKESITQIIAKNHISNDEIYTLYQLYNKYPLQADEAIKKLSTDELGNITRLLSETEDGRTVLAVWKFKTKLAEDLGVDVANNALDFWVKNTGGVYVDATTRRSFMSEHRWALRALGIGSMIPIWFMFQGQEFKLGMVGYGYWPTPIYLRWKAAYQKTFDVESILKADCNSKEGIRLAKEVVAEMNWLINYCIENPIVEDVEFTEKMHAQYGPGVGSANDETIMTMENQRDGFIEVVNTICPGTLTTDKYLPESFDAVVKEIADGDTVIIEYAEQDYEVRLLGINTPENKDHKYTCTELKEPFLVRRLVTPGKACVEEEIWHADQEFFDSNKVWIGSNLPVTQMATFYSDLDDQFDKYNRLLASAYYNNKYVSNESLRAGQSVVFFYSDNKQVNQADFLAAEKIAKDANKGIWAFKTEPGETGWIKFISTPTAAEVYLDGVNIGKTVSNILLVETTLGLHTYEFKKVGYIGCKGEILEINQTHTENDPFERTCTLELKEPTCPNPNASFVISPTSPDVNETITFDASASTAGGDESIDSYTWDFGDGTDGSGRVVTHSYVSAGSYVAKLTVRNDCRETDVSTKTISIKEIVDTGDVTVKTYSAPGITLSGVTVYVDNIDKGNAPVTIKDLGIGSHSIRLEKTGYLGCSYCIGTGCAPGAGISPCDFSVNIEKDITTVLEVTMQKVFEVEIMSTPDGAIIKVDGEAVTTQLNMIEQILRAKIT